MGDAFRITRDGSAITVSGGEPMMHPEETIALLRAAKSEGMTTAIETCGFFDEKLQEAFA